MFFLEKHFRLVKILLIAHISDNKGCEFSVSDTLFGQFIDSQQFFKKEFKKKIHN